MMKLKPCPFCGNDYIKFYNKKDLFVAECPTCLTRQVALTEEEAIENWNYRQNEEDSIEENKRFREDYLIELLKKALETLSKIKLRANEERSMCGVTFDFALEIEELADESIDKIKAPPAKEVTPFGRLLREYRIAKDERLYDMAQRLNISSAEMCSYETGKKEPSQSIIKALAKDMAGVK